MDQARVRRTVTLGSRHRNGQRLNAFYNLLDAYYRAALSVWSGPARLRLRPACRGLRMLRNDTQGRLLDRFLPEHPGLDPDDHSH